MGCNDYASVKNGSQQLEQTRFFSRQLVAADDFTTDQDYYREKRRMHNRLLHGWGIVCGLEVKDPLPGAPLVVTICPGYALSPQGDEIYLPAEVQFDLGQCIKGPGIPCPSPCGSVVSVSSVMDSPFYIAIKYTQCLSHPVRVPPLGCGCDETSCEYSRIRDGYELTCLQTLPKTHLKSEDLVGICGEEIMNSKVVPCLPCPSDPWIVLAKVTPGSPTIDPDGRHLLLATSVMQQHLIFQCM